MKKILLVDDDSDIRKIYATVFSEKGFDVDMAENGEEGFDKIVNSSYDLVLLDVQMPKLDGLEVLRKINDRHERFVTPIFLLTNLGTDEIVNEASKLGVKGVFVKALYKPSELFNKINSFLN